MPAQSRETPQAPFRRRDLRSISSQSPRDTKQLADRPTAAPVIASAALRPDACNVEINCCHAASDGMVRMWSKAEKYLANGERQCGQSQQSA